MEQGTTLNACSRWAASLHRIVQISLHLRQPSPVQPPAAYLDSPVQNKSTIPEQSHLTPPYLQPHALCLWGFAWNRWAFHRADAAVWVTASPRNEFLHISCSMETAHVHAWILCNALWGHLHASEIEIICLLHIYPGEEQSVSHNYLGTSDGASNVRAWLRFGWFGPPSCRKRSLKQEPWLVLPLRLALFQSSKQGNFMQTTC